MIQGKNHSGDCLILPLQSQTIITAHDIPPLRLPGEQLPRRARWQPLVAIFFSLSLWLNPTPTHAAVTSDEILSATNAERGGIGLGPLTLDTRLAAAAAAKANDMIAQQYFSHASPTGLRGWHWMRDAGYPYTEAGENLAMDFLESQDVVTAWMGSAGHRQNMMSQKFLDTGIATVPGTLNGKKSLIVVMLFGRQSSVTAVAMPDIVAPTPRTTTPDFAPTPTALVDPLPPLPTSSTTETTRIPSLIQSAGVPAPVLTFTPVDPDPRYLNAAQPAVLGVSTMQAPSPIDPVLSAAIATAILSGLFIAAATIALASRWWSSIYPQVRLHPVPNSA